MDSLQSFKLYTLFLLTNNLEKVKNCMPSECPTFNSPVLSQHESKNWQKNIEPSFTRIKLNQKNLLRLTLHNSNKNLKSFSVLLITLLKDFDTN